MKEDKRNSNRNRLNLIQNNFYITIVYSKTSLKIKNVFSIYNNQPKFLKILELTFAIGLFLLNFGLFDDLSYLATEDENGFQTIPVWVTKSGPFSTKVFDDGSSITFDLGTTKLMYLQSKDGINAMPPEGLEFDTMTTIHGPYAEFDQKEYFWNDNVHVTIFDLWRDGDPNKIERLGSFNDNDIIISTNRGTLDYIAEETGTDTGIFTLELQLTGFAGFDANGDGNYDMEGITYGQGPRNGKIATSNDDEITVSYEVSPGNFVTASAPITMYQGELYIFPNEGKQNSFVVYLEDWDINFDFQKQEKAYVTLISDSDPNGIELELKETDWPGRFKGEFKISSDLTKENLYAYPGDKITIIYYDNTLPFPYSIGDVEKIIDFVFYESNIDLVNR